MTAETGLDRGIEQFAPAKINLTLHVTGQRADGYHLLDSLVVFADIGDRVWLKPAKEMTLDVTGRFARGVPCDAGNLVWQAVQAAGQICHIRLEKNLPRGAGLGGGSADAAAILRALDAPEHALRLGADVPVCLSTAPQRMRGVGEVVEPIPLLLALDLVLVNPNVSIATPEVFWTLQTKINADMGTLPAWRSKADFLTWLRAQRNDLQQAASQLVPQIADVIEELADAQLARMSGSGTTCFGLYDDRSDAHRAAERIAKAHPNWWVQPTRSIDLV